MKNENKILLAHGSGGRLTHNLIKNIFAKHFNNEYISPLLDSALIELSSKNIALTTDSYVINPINFPGGNIGTLAVSGTVNDLAVVGATPLYMTCGMIIEEGLTLEELEGIVLSMAETASKAGVKIVTGDTKVVEKGSADKIFINTSGVGILNPEAQLGYSYIEPGDKIIVSGTVGDHGMAIMAAREGLGLSSTIESDCAPLNGIIDSVICRDVKFMRDPTRGGLATTLCEIAESGGLDIEIDETKIPISENVRGISEILGIDPLYSANEGKFIAIVRSDAANKILETIKSHPIGRNANIIGCVSASGGSGGVILKTEIGTRRQIQMLTGAQLPRIC